MQHERPEAAPAIETRKRRVRLLVRGTCLLIAALALWHAGTSLWVPALSPFVALGGAIAIRGFPAAAWLGMVVGVAALVKRRVFCRWICPMGFCLDGASRLGRRLGRRPGRGPLFGQWIVLLTLGGACLGYPLLLWLDPLAIFAGIFAFGSHPGHATFVGAAGFVTIVVLSIVWPGLWCGRVCPLGALQDLLYVTPRSLRWPVHKGPAGGGEDRLSRRVLLGAAAGAGSAGALGLIGTDRVRPLRPPNAREESQFVGLCTRCGNCLRSCPTGIIGRDLGGSGWASLLTPILSFREGYCREDCTRCTEVCPSGAIARLPVKAKSGIRIGLPRVDMNLCLLGDDRECSACARWCPYGAIRYVFSEAEYALRPQIDLDKCSGCGACEAACPTKPHKAIVVHPA